MIAAPALSSLFRSYGFANGNIYSIVFIPSFLIKGPHHMRQLIVRSRKILKAQDQHLEFTDHSKIWQASQQHSCWAACQILKQFEHFKAILQVQDIAQFYDNLSHGILKPAPEFHGFTYKTRVAPICPYWRYISFASNARTDWDYHTCVSFAVITGISSSFMHPFHLSWSHWDLRDEIDADIIFKWIFFERKFLHFNSNCTEVWALDSNCC